MPRLDSPLDMLFYRAGERTLNDQSDSRPFPLNIGERVGTGKRPKDAIIRPGEGTTIWRSWGGAAGETSSRPGATFGSGRGRG